MTSELIFLAILLVGIVLMGIGVLRYRSLRGPRYRDRFRQVGEAGSRVADYIAGRVRGAYRGYRRFAGMYSPLNDQEQQRLQQQIGQIVAQGEAQGLTQQQIEQQIRTLPLFQRGERVRNLQGSISQYHPGGINRQGTGEGIYGERSRGGVYAELKDILDSAEIGHPLKYVQNLGDLFGGWLDRRRRREENQEE